LLILSKNNDTGKKQEKKYSSGNEGTILDNIELIFSSSLLEGSIKTPDLVSITVDRERFLKNLYELKQSKFSFNSMVAIPGASDNHKIKYFFQVQDARDMEILVIIGVDLEKSEKMGSIRDIFPAAGSFEEELEAYGVF